MLRFGIINTVFKEGANMWKWIREHIFVKDMFLYIFIGAAIFYIPAWVALIVGVITNNDLLITFSATYVLVWMGPFTPTVPAILAIAIFIKEVIKRKK